MTKHKHLSIAERYMIKDLLYQKKNITEIARCLNCPKSTISMEISRNSELGKYMPCVSHSKYKSRLHNPKGLKIERNQLLQDYIKIAMIDYKWSPDVISGRMKLEGFPEVVSTETIYRYIYTSAISRRLKLYTHLVQKRLQRQARGKRVTRQAIPDRISIHDREAIADEKLELGHFEIDLTFQKGNKSKNIGVMVDKASQKLVLVLNRCKRSLTVTTGFLSKMETIPASLRKTLTMDNGKEFVGHVAYRLKGFKTFFCDAYRPRQKDLVEKMNSMIHRILPKNIDIDTIAQNTLDQVAEILNNMPRKIFGYKTPNEIWKQKLSNATKKKRGGAGSKKIIDNVQFVA